jgi:hypothetical protein
MNEKQKKIMKLIKEHGSKEDLKAEKEVCKVLLHMMDQIGVKTLIMLEKPHKEISMMTTGISEEAFATIVARVVTDFPNIPRRIIEEMNAIKAIQLQKDENNTSPPEATIH